MGDVKVSVIVPVYNAEKYLEECLDSILAQTFGDIEIICVNDGSTDRSAEILARYAATDSRFVLLRQENSGAGPARNLGLANARGEYVIFLDSDDFFEPKMIEDSFNRAEETTADIVVFDGQRYDRGNGSHIGAHFLNMGAVGNKNVFAYQDLEGRIFTTPGPVNKLYRRSFIEDGGFQFLPLPNSEDVYFVLMALFSAQRIACVDKLFYNYRVGQSTNLESNKESNPLCFYEAYMAVYRELVQRGIFEENKKCFYNHMLSSCVYNLNTITGEAQEKLYAALSSAEFLKTGILDYPPAYYQNINDFNRVRECSVKKAKHRAEMETGGVPLVSIVMPVYNVEEYLEECLDSIVGQTLKNIEIICVDDGSTDRSTEILARYAAADSRFVLLRQVNSGAGPARNLGLANARGEYVIFLDPDDFFEVDMLETCFDKAEETAADVVVFDGRTYNNNTGETANMPSLLDKQAIKNMPVFSYADLPPGRKFTIASPWNKFYRRCFIEKENLQFQALPNSNDIYFVLMSLFVAKRITCVNKEFVNYRIGLKKNAQSNRAQNPLCFYEAYMAVYRELVQRGIFEKYKEYFYSSMLLGCAHNLDDTTITESARQVLYDALTSDEFLEIGILDQEPTYYINAYYTVKGCAYVKEWQEKLAKKNDAAGETVIKMGKCKNPAVSVIVPVYNTEGYLADCMDSILCQTLKNIEVLCMNDGSTDSCLEILSDYAERDARISVFSQENQGQSAARNACIHRAKGKYIYFMDSDDLLEPDALKTLYQRMEQDRLDIIYFDGRIFYDSDDESLKDVRVGTYYDRQNDYPGVFSGAELMQEMQGNKEYGPSPCLQMTRRAFFLENDLYFIDGIVHEDNAYNYKAMLKAKRVGYVHRQLFLRRLRTNSTMTKTVSFANVYGKFICYLDQLKTYETFLQTCRGGGRLYSAGSHFDKFA